MHNFQRLTKKDWVADYGFRKALAADPGTMKFAGQMVGAGRSDIVEYWQREKSHYPLWELLLYMGSHTAPQTLAYFDLPADTVEFVRGGLQRGVARGAGTGRGNDAGFRQRLRPAEFLPLCRAVRGLAAHRRARGPRRQRPSLS